MLKHFELQVVNLKVNDVAFRFIPDSNQILNAVQVGSLLFLKSCLSFILALLVSFLLCDNILLTNVNLQAKKQFEDNPVTGDFSGVPVFLV